MENNQTQTENSQSQTAENSQNAQSQEPQANMQNSQADDVQKNKPIAIIGYILPILFFIPLVSDAKNSEFAKFHANQQLVLLITAVLLDIVGGVIPILGWFIVLPLGSLFVFIAAIMGIINAAKGEKNKLPLIGGYQIIK